MKILIINGPNLNMLGKREPEIYGSLSLDEINSMCKNYASKLAIELDFFQSNIEGEIITKIQQSGTYDGLIINPAAYSHYSIAILDALNAIDIIKVEVHISNIAKRETFRQQSLTSKGCDGVISGFGYKSYFFAIKAIKGML